MNARISTDFLHYLSSSKGHPKQPIWLPWVQPLLEKILKVKSIERIYAALPKATTAEQFLEKVIERFQFRLEVDGEDMCKIPESGPMIAAANHPFGGVEGLLLASLLLSRRKDVKIMANPILSALPELKDLFIPTDPFSNRPALYKNVKALRQAVGWLSRGGLLVIFPAGEVSHLDLRERKVCDPPWNSGILHLLKKTQAPVLPVFFPGRNGFCFQAFGLIHPKLRTAMLAREFLNKKKKTIHLRIGKVIHYESISLLPDDADRLDYLRKRTEMLRYRKSYRPAHPLRLRPRRKHRPLLPPKEAQPFVDEIFNLPANQTLLRQGPFRVAFSYAPQTPFLLQEIGRLREGTFRLVGEGTGKELDIDIYDSYYLHLFVFKEDSREIIGAYRLGQTDRVLSRMGRKSLYTQTLFTFHPAFFQKVHPGLELGRSFVRPEYQKSYQALLLLWKGIGRFVARYPRYRFLFGPVSISNDYKIPSKMLMVIYLNQTRFLPEWARWVKPKKPFAVKRDRWMEEAACRLLNTIEEVSEWISEWEERGQGVPVLLKQYLKLGGGILGFNVDPKFNGALDGLILVDLLRADRRMLEKYMGREGLEGFLSYHQLDTSDNRSGRLPGQQAA
jgi:putative hemolysin